MRVPLPSRFFFFHSHTFLPLLRRILLPHVLGKVCLLQRKACVGFWACITLYGIGFAQTKASVCIAHWVHIPAIPFPFHGPAGHVDPLGLLPLFLGFFGPLFSYFLIVLPMGLLAVIPAMLAH